MSELPAGRWSPILVGHQWPGPSSLSVLAAAIRSREVRGEAYRDYADTLRSVRTGALAPLDGIAAERAREGFRRGEDRAAEVAARNLSKRDAYAGALGAARALRSELESVAEQGNAAIEGIIESDGPVPAKISAVVAAVTAARAQADILAARYGAETFDVIDRVLASDGAGLSARRFAAAHGVDTPTGSVAPDVDAIAEQVRARIGAAPEDSPAGAATPPPVAPIPARPAATAPAAPRSPGPPGHPGRKPAQATGERAAAAAPGTGTPAPTPGAPGSAPAGRSVAAAAVVRVVPTGRPAPAPAAATATDEPVRGDDLLDRVLATVVRQEPGLAWAVGERPDGTAVLATDLGGGWIPPHIGVPVGVVLLQPLPAGAVLLQPRPAGAGLADILGPVTRAVFWRPGGRLPRRAEPLPTSPQARYRPGVADLGWELGRATRWRVGLPRLAHTLARAACAGTGCPDSEIRVLAEHTAAVRGRVMDRYPGEAGTDLGNWQLLATVAALAAGEKSTAHYHFAWFRAAASGTRDTR